MIDVFFLRPSNTSANQMKRRMGAAKGVALHDLVSEEAVRELRPPSESVFIFHLSAASDLPLCLSQIRALSKAGGESVRSIVIDETRDPKVKQVVEALPQALYFSTERTAHDIDQLVLKLVKQLLASQAPIRQETLVYQEQKENFIAVEREPTQTIKSEAVVVQPKKSSPNKFRPVTDPEQQQKLLNDALSSHADVVLSNFGSHDEVRGALKTIASDTKSFSVILDGSEQKLASFQSTSMTSKKIAISISLQQSRVFLVSTDFKWISKTTIELKVPSLVYFVQRRKDFRWIIAPEQNFTISFPVGSLKMKFKIHDISAGGVAILCAPEDLSQLKSQGETSAAQLVFETNDWNVGPLKFRQSQDFESDSGESLTKVGYSFEKMPTVYKKTLGDYVDRKARAYVLNYVVEQ